MDSEDGRPILGVRQIDKDWREAAFAYLLGCKLPHVVCSGDDEHARMWVRQPAEQRTNHPARRAAVRSSGRLHAAYCLFVFRQMQQAFRSSRGLARTFDGY